MNQIRLNEINPTLHSESEFQNYNDFVSAFLDNFDFHSVEIRNAAFAECIENSPANLCSIVMKYDPIPFMKMKKLETSQ